MYSNKKKKNIRKEILKVLSERNSLSYTEIQRALSTNYLSVKDNCKELEEYGFVKVNTMEKHPRNNHRYFKVVLTESGKKVASDLD